jgi:hypothetical protein
LNKKCIQQNLVLFVLELLTFFLVYFNKNGILKNLRGLYKNRSRAAGCAPLEYTIDLLYTSGVILLCYDDEKRSGIWNISVIKSSGTF